MYTLSLATMDSCGYHHALKRQQRFSGNHSLMKIETTELSAASVNVVGQVMLKAKREAARPMIRISFLFSLSVYVISNVLL